MRLLGALCAGAILLTLGAGRAAAWQCVKDIRDAGPDGRLCSGSTRPDGQDAAPAPVVAPAAAGLATGAAGLLGNVFGAGLVQPLPPMPKRAAIKPLEDENEKPEDPSVRRAVQAAQGILSDETASQPVTARSACDDDPGVVCLAGREGIVDMSSVSEGEMGPMVDAAAEPAGAATKPAVPPAKAPAAKAADKLRESIAAAWEHGSEWVEHLELGAGVAKVFKLVPKGLGGASETLGTVGRAVGVVNAGLEDSRGEHAKAGGSATGIALGMASEPAGVGAKLCGASESCSNFTVGAANAAANAPITAAPVASFVKNNPDRQMIEVYALQNGGDYAKATARAQQDVQDRIDRLKATNSGGITSFFCGVMGSGKGECK